MSPTYKLLGSRKYIYSLTYKLSIRYATRVCCLWDYLNTKLGVLCIRWRLGRLMSYVGKRATMLSANGCTKEMQGKRKRKLVMYLRTRTTFILNLSLDFYNHVNSSRIIKKCIPILIALYPCVFQFRFSQIHDFCCHRIIDNIEIRD